MYILLFGELWASPLCLQFCHQMEFNSFRCTNGSESTHNNRYSNTQYRTLHSSGGGTHPYISSGLLLKGAKSLISLSISSLSVVTVDRPVSGDGTIMKSHVLIFSHSYAYLRWFSQCVGETSLRTIMPTCLGSAAISRSCWRHTQTHICHFRQN